MKLPSLSPYLKKLDDSIRTIFDRYDLYGPRLVYNIECRNPIAFDKICDLINDWSDREHDKSCAEGKDAFLGDYCSAYIEEAGENNISLRLGDPQVAIQMLKELGDTIRRIQHDYPPIRRGVDLSGLKAFDRDSLIAAGVPFNESPLPPHRPPGRSGGR